MDFTLSKAIRRSRMEILLERIAIKTALREQLRGHGDIVDLHKLFNIANSDKPITYASVAYALNPNSQLWSPRVIEFAGKYIAARKIAQEENASNQSLNLLA